jgi:hypothetical protein
LWFINWNWTPTDQKCSATCAGQTRWTH